MQIRCKSREIFKQHFVICKIFPVLHVVNISNLSILKDKKFQFKHVKWHVKTLFFSIYFYNLFSYDNSCSSWSEFTFGTLLKPVRKHAVSTICNMCISSHTYIPNVLYWHIFCALKKLYFTLSEFKWMCNGILSTIPWKGWIFLCNCLTSRPIL